MVVLIIPPEGICDCAGDPYGEADLDDCGVCEGDNEDMDICGECFGNGSSCDLGAISDVYYLNKVKLYQSTDCSGSPSITYYGPQFNLSDEGSYHDNECSWDEGSYETVLSVYMDLAANGTYGLLIFDSDMEDWEHCSDHGSYCDNGECSHCCGSVENTSDVEFEVGEWEIYNNNLNFSLEYFKETMWGERTAFYSTCGDTEYSESNYYGCLDENTLDWGSYSYDGSFWLDGNPDSYDLSGNTLTMQFVDYYYDYYYDNYYYDYDDYRCAEYEWRTTNSFPSVQGCTDEGSELYNPFATSDDGSCNAGYCYNYYSAQNPPAVEEKKSIFFNSDNRRPHPNQNIPNKQK